MTGEMMINYIVLCDGDLEMTVTLADLLKNEAVARAIKNAYAKGKRDIEAVIGDPGSMTIKNKKAVQTVTIPKENFMDALTLAEEDARSKKLLKKGCERIEIIDIETL